MGFEPIPVGLLRPMPLPIGLREYFMVGPPGIEPRPFGYEPKVRPSNYGPIY